MSYQFWDRLRAYLKRGRIYGHENLLSNQTDLTRITSTGDVVNQSNSYSLLEQTNLQINRLERYKDFDQMDEIGEISLALDLYADEASLTDPERKHVIFIRSKHKEVKEELEHLFYDILTIDMHLRSMVRYLVKYGDMAFEILTSENRDSVQALKHLNIYNFTRIETRQNDLVGFFFQDEMTSSPVFFHPWQVMHMRLTSYENIYHPYGRSILDGARKAFKQLRLMEDAAIIYRLTRAPEKRVFTIPIGNIPTREIPNYMEMVSRQFKRKKIFDPASGDMNERWSPHLQEDDFWLPVRPDGSGPKVDTLPGAENLDQIADIEYFKKKMISALKVPFARVGIGDQSEDSRQSLSQVAPEFAKAVQHIQREVGIGLKKVALVHLALKGYTTEQMKSFDIAMTSSSAIDELYRIETWKSRADVIVQLKDTGYFTPEWILSRFTDMTADEIELLEIQRREMASDEGDEEEGGLGGGGGGGGGGGLSLPGFAGGGGGDLGGGLEGGDKELDLGGEGGDEAEEPKLETKKKKLRTIIETHKSYTSIDKRRMINEIVDTLGIEEENITPELIKNMALSKKEDLLDIINLMENYRPWDKYRDPTHSLLNNGELDGLSGKDNNVEIVSYVSEDEADEAKDEAKEILLEMLGKKTKSEEQNPVTEDQEITNNDVREATGN